ncbi:hypothetical protein GCM10010255_50370 [Streptomyces coeruleofuscus]|uniref:Uncharacterized protein n=1 Tax=Streptomyces coeruleofuscus TaxID=66879 RepID=A0ABN3INC4_9ACTN
MGRGAGVRPRAVPRDWSPAPWAEGRVVALVPEAQVPVGPVAASAPEAQVPVAASAPEAQVPVGPVAASAPGAQAPAGARREGCPCRGREREGHRCPWAAPVRVALVSLVPVVLACQEVPVRCSAGSRAEGAEQGEGRAP